jgi:hypothetical protein
MTGPLFSRFAPREPEVVAAPTDVGELAG